jgi:PEP-CTERM motif
MLVKGDFMTKLRVCVLAIAAAGCALLFSPGGARADSLTGSVVISWLYPNTSTTILTDTIAVGSSLNCPGASPICSGYGGVGSETFSVGTSAISYTASTGGGSYNPAAFNGFDFTGLTFLSGGTLTGFTLTTNMAGLTSSLVSFTGSSIEINLESLPADGTFTLNLFSSGGTAVPEPSSLALLGSGLLALVGFVRRKAIA